MLAVWPFQGDAQAQDLGCRLEPAGITARQVLRCQDGATIEAEAGADYTLLDHDRDGRPDAASLRSGALFVDIQARLGRRGFQVVTPQAIAAVRGTQWAVDVSGSRTSVFVVNGSVAVRRVNAQSGVTLGPGEGVDVEPGTAPLRVNRWSPARASALMARLGRQLR